MKIAPMDIAIAALAQFVQVIAGSGALCAKPTPESTVPRAGSRKPAGTGDAEDFCTDTLVNSR